MTNRSVRALAGFAAITTAASLAAALPVFEFDEDYTLGPMSGSGFETPDITLVGAAEWGGDPTQNDIGVLRITPDEFGRTGSAWRNDALLRGDLDWTTTFRIAPTELGGVPDQNGNQGGDGFGFFLHTGDLNANPGFIGGPGVSSLNISFDNFLNFDEAFDYTGTVWLNRQAIGTFDIGSLGPGGSPMDWEDDIHEVVVSYDAAATLLSISVLNETTGESVAFSVIADLAAAGLESSIVGFSSFTGGSFQNHDVHSWSFSGTPVPTPGLAVPLAIGLAFGTRRRR